MINIKDVEQWPKEIGGGYWFDENGECSYQTVNYDKNGVAIDTEREPIANFTPLLKEQRRLDNGIEVKESLVFQAYRAYHLWEETLTDAKQILGQNPQAVFGAGCRVYLGGRRISKVARLRELMQIQCEAAQISTVYQHTGYAEIDGKRVFLNGRNSVTAEGLTDCYNVSLEDQLSMYGFTDERHDERYDTLFNGLFAVAPESLIYAGLGLSFLTPLNALLREIGAEPCFLLYFTGKTQIGKSTMGRLFLNFFGSFQGEVPSPASFRDTPNAVEKKFAVLDSTLVMIDDRFPNATQQIKAQMEAMEQSIARQIGDRSGRARMNADGSLKAIYRPKCNVIVTAEDSFSNVGESAIARAISVEWTRDDINLEKLSAVQANAIHLNECMAEYIQFVIGKWDALKSELEPRFYRLRTAAQTDGHRRLAVCVAHLEIGIYVMCKWLLAIGKLTEKRAKEIRERAWTVFMKLAEEQNRRISEETPVKLFLDAVKEMLDRGTIKIVDLPLKNYMSADKDADRTVGFKDADYIYFHPGGIFAAVKRYYDEQGRNFPVSQTALFRDLKADGLIEPDSTQNTKPKNVNGKTVRRLWLKKTAIEGKEVVEI